MLLHLTILATLLCAGCDFGVVYVDPDVTYRQGGHIIEGDPTVTLGFYREQLFVPVSENAEAPIVAGNQTGFWLHPAVRTEGIGSPAIIDCESMTEDGESVGSSASQEDFVLTPDGFFEKSRFPLSVPRDDPEPLYGVGATLTCTVSDEEDREATSMVDVVLVEG